jgi:hypothetical protein
MPNKFARSNGDFNNSSIWSLSATGLSATTVPSVGDNAISNNFTVQITGNVACDNITNSNLYGGTAGGTFGINNGAVIASNLLAGSTATACMLLSGTASGSIIGNATGGTGSSSHCLSLTNTTGTLSITGNIFGGTGSIARGINTTTNSEILIYGNISSSNAAEGILRTSTTVALSVFGGNIINAPNGRQAINAPRYQVFPGISATYTRQAVNGYDSYADYWTSNATFSYPASSDVVLSTVYSNNTLSGSMALPPASAVVFGAPVGTTSGTASITLEGLLNQSIATLNTSNSIGARLKNVVTTQALSAVANSLDFNN